MLVGLGNAMWRPDLGFSCAGRLWMIVACCCCRRFYLCQSRLKCFLLSCEPVWLVHALAVVFGFMAAMRVR
jgi:hypothetical protein